MKAIWIAVMCFIFGSCSDLKDYYASVNQSPVIEFPDVASIVKNEVTDSLKLGFEYHLRFTIEDEEKLKLILPSNPGYSISSDSSEIKIKGKSEGHYILFLEACDSFKKYGRATITLTVFSNLLPQAILNYVIEPIGDSYQLLLDGSSSYDRDKKFGGAVSEFKFTINTNTIQSTESKIRVSVNKDQTYTLRFQVEDNNDAWSDEIVMYVKI
jgi:hypothetical protein